MPPSRRKSPLENELGAEQRIPDLACQSDICEAAKSQNNAQGQYVSDHRRFAMSGAKGIIINGIRNAQLFSRLSNSGAVTADHFDTDQVDQIPRPGSSPDPRDRYSPSPVD